MALETKIFNNKNKFQMENETSNNQHAAIKNIVGNLVLAAVHCYPIFTYEVKGVSTHYTDKMWVDDENEPDGGYYTNVEKRHKHPKVIVDFYADVNIDLQVNGQYYDGENVFIAVGKHTIRNAFTEVDRFKIPQELALIGSSHCG
jgi:hypothetical protein